MQRISFVIPCYRSELTIENVVNEIKETMEVMSQHEYEIILVNDSSPDNTLAIIQKLIEKEDHVIGIDLAKNFGQHAALMAGLHQVTGDIIVCLDDDGQTPANEVNKLLDQIIAGHDVVYAKYEHKHHSPFRNWGSKINELMTRMMLGKPKELYISSYFATKRFVVEEILRYENSFPYVMGLVLRSTDRKSVV